MKGVAAIGEETRKLKKDEKEKSVKGGGSE